MMIPSIVSSERSAFRRSPRIARRTLVRSIVCHTKTRKAKTRNEPYVGFSWFRVFVVSWPAFRGSTPSLTSQRLNRVQRRGALSREPAKENPDRSRDADRQQDRAGRDGGRPLQVARQAGRRREPERHAHDAAGQAEHHRLED